MGAASAGGLRGLVKHSNRPVCAADATMMQVPRHPGAVKRLLRGPTLCARRASFQPAGKWHVSARLIVCKRVGARTLAILRM